MQTATLSKRAMPKGLGLSSKLRLGGGFQAACMPVHRLALPSRAIQGPKAFKEGEDEVCSLLLQGGLSLPGLCC